jgi:prevent-host-death family protein
MPAVSLRDLKNHLGEHLRRVQDGQRITVTDGGRPIAEITPIRAEVTTLEERLAKLEAAGEITLPRGKKARGRPKPAVVKGRPVAETLLEDRG